ncbi:phytoene desaturase family protein [Amorphus orientalis]|uniref:Pyridine nucleotide-disulfide oxidoreductase domain-containing protein 2 n=1 Tax=Amorphus orientalis TaxID=649198 RepID=A0AAE4ASX0_9HYPH|nr:NAD(P)/FAD-dependent oxidoreductase [Amorphus orientalis]MDQ0315435.1 phytoene dehydrogenase-like protein [Amorphus orientalis]
MEFDAVFVGAGHNALAAAVHMASKGWSVGVFERNDTAGGAVRTEEVTLPGFRHDLYATNLGMFGGSAFFQAHGEALQKHGLAFVPAENCFASPMPDGRWFGLSKDLETTVARASRLSPADGERWRAMVAQFGEDAPYLFGLLGSPMSWRAMAGLGLKAWRKKGTRWLLDTARLLASSPREFVEENFESPEIRAALATWGMHLDFAPDVAGGALFPYLESMADQSFGMVIGQGGADTIVKAMVARIEELGGTVRTGAEVTGITSSGGKATGITLTGGETVQAKRAVIAGVTPSALVRLTGGTTGEKRYDDGARKFRHAPGAMMVHLAMSDLPDWSADPELKEFLYVHLAPDLEMISRAYSEAKSGLLPKEPVLVVGQQTNVDPSRAPDGQHTLWIQVRMVPGEIKGDAAGEIAARDWADAAEPYADRVISILERYAPGTRDKILARYVESPADLERRNPNLVGGDSLGGSHHLSQNFLFRPVAGYANHKTPVKGLYLIGASTWPGGGTGAGSGFTLARTLAGH